jgi:hypothetical protein
VWAKIQQQHLGEDAGDCGIRQHILEEAIMDNNDVSLLSVIQVEEKFQSYDYRALISFKHKVKLLLCLID